MNYTIEMTEGKQPVSSSERGQYRLRSALMWLMVLLGMALLPLFLAWIGARPGRGWLIELGVGLGLVGLGLLVVQAWTSGRQAFVGGNFGADNLMHFHRHLGVFAVLTALAHPVTLGIAEPEYLRFLDPRSDWMRAAALWVLSGALVLIALSSYFRNLFGLSYELWRLSHGVLALVILVLGLVHVLRVDHHLGELWKQLLLLTFVGSGIYLVIHSRLIRPMLARRRPWKVTSVKPERGDTWTLKLEPVAHDGLTFEPGQYAWLTLGKTPLALQQHPFSFASAANSGSVAFSASAAGDFTRSLRDVEPGTLAWIEGPFGSFVPDPDPGVSLFLVAGGIGITPMMSMLRTFRHLGERRRIILLYANPELDQATFAEELEMLEQQLNLEVVQVLEDPPENWHGESGIIDEALLLRYLGRLDEPVQYMTCGPAPLMDQLVSVLHSRGVNWRRVFSERFEIV